MGKIAFIKALAFIISFIVKIVVVPLGFIVKIIVIFVNFWRKIAEMFFLLLRNLCNRIKKRKEEKRKAKEAERKNKESARAQREKLKKEKRKERDKKRQERAELTERKWVDRAKKAKEIKEYLGRNKGKLSWFVGIILACIVMCYVIIGRTIQICFRKGYWFARLICQKIYWRVRTLCQKVYWRSFSLCQRLYWRVRTLCQRIYWKVRTLCQKIYWKYYEYSRKIYADLTKNDYIDLFFIYFRGRLKKSQNIIRCVKIIGIKEYVQQHKKTCVYNVVEEAKERIICIPEYFEKNKEETYKCLSPEIYIAKLLQTYVIGGSNVVVSKGMLLNDAAFYDQENRIDIRYSAIKKVFQGVALIEDTKEAEQLPRAINLVGAASFNYYHLIVEILSRLAFVDTFDEYRSYPILIDEIVMTIPQYRDALACFNKLNHPIIVAEKGKKYSVNEMIIPSSNVWMPTNVYDRAFFRKEDFVIAEETLKHIREAVGVWCEEKPWRKIFISRKNTQAVRLKNEEEVRRIFEEHGYEIVYTEEMTFRQQVECFGQAKCIVAASGAALTNTIFCQPRTIIGCIFPAESVFYMYSTIAHILELQSLFLDCEIVEKTNYISLDAFVLDHGYAERYIELIERIQSEM